MGVEPALPAWKAEVLPFIKVEKSAVGNPLANSFGFIKESQSGNDQ
jgi:hypothetical protein